MFLIHSFLPFFFIFLFWTESQIYIYNTCDLMTTYKIFLELGATMVSKKARHRPSLVSQSGGDMCKWEITIWSKNFHHKGRAGSQNYDSHLTPFGMSWKLSGFSFNHTVQKSMLLDGEHDATWGGGARGWRDWAKRKKDAWTWTTVWWLLEGWGDKGTKW